MMARVDVSGKAKEIRAKVIVEYMRENNITQCVCFSCGNASRALKQAGARVVEIAPKGDLLAGRWWTMAEIRRTFPTCFDATSGHLPVDLLVKVAERLRLELAEVFKAGGTYCVPTGSGETVLCLAMAFPQCQFLAEYNNANPATKYDEQAPLNAFIRAFVPNNIQNKPISGDLSAFRSGSGKL